MSLIDWPQVPNAPEGFVCRILLRTPRESEHAKWVREMNAFHQVAMDTRGRHRTSPSPKVCETPEIPYYVSFDPVWP